MAILVRLSLRIPSEGAMLSASALDRQLLPILRQYEVTPAAETGRPSAPGFYSQLFQTPTIQSLHHVRQMLPRDEQWSSAVRDLGLSGGGTEETSWRLDPYRVPIRSPHSRPLGPGYRQGVLQTLTTADGLPSSWFTAVLCDQQQDLWFASMGGLIRYDGDVISIWSEAEGLPSTRIWSLLEDRHGRLWVGTTNGVSCWQDGEMDSFTVVDGLAADRVSSICEDHRGHLWFGSAAQGQAAEPGLTRFDGENFHTYATEDGLDDVYVNCICADSRQNVWIGTHCGVTCFDGRTFTSYTLADGLRDTWVHSVLEDRDGDLLFSHRCGADRLVDGCFVPVPASDGRALYSATLDEEGAGWFGSAGGVATGDRHGLATRFTVRDGLANDQVTGICSDGMGRLWFATLSGISRYDRRQFRHYSTGNGLSTDVALCLLRSASGSIWCGSPSGLHRLDGTQFTDVSSMAGRHVWDLAIDAKGTLWCAGLGGLHRVNEDEATEVTGSEGWDLGWPKPGVLSVSVDQQDEIWFSGVGGFYHVVDGVPSIWDPDSGFADAVGVVHHGDDGTLWIGLKDGRIVRCTEEERRVYGLADGLGQNPVRWLKQLSDGALWAGTLGGGILRYDGVSWDSLTTAEGLAANEVNCIVEDRQGRLWIGTFGGGVTLYDGTVFQTLSRRTGLIHDAVHTVIDDEEGSMWIATEGGITQYRPSSIPPRVRIVSVIADRRYDAAHTVHINSGAHLVAFELAGSSSTTYPADMAFVVQLEGHTDGWRPVYAPRVEFQDLSEGTYHFQVKAVDRDLNYSDPVELTLVIEPDPQVEALTLALNESAPGGEFLGRSQSIRQLQTKLAQVARTDLTVLITGETGTGKGLAARMLHRLSDRSAGPLIQVNCGAMPEALVESELFGHERGAFTGAVSRRLGKVELAASGTLFLDEIGDMPLEAQVKLLRLLEEQTFERVGGIDTLEAQIRIVAATNRDLAQMVQEGTFREDLFYRLQVFPVAIPPLRERAEDIPLLGLFFMERMAAHVDKSVTRIDPAAMTALKAYAWPGNVRELEHALQRAVITCQGDTIQFDELALGGIASTAPATGSDGLVTLDENERSHILRVLEQTDWVIKGPRGAAAILGRPESTLRNRMKRLGIQRQAPQ